VTTMTTTLKEVREHVHNYVQECSNNMPLRSVYEQTLVLAYANVMPDELPPYFDRSADNAQDSWLIATCWFLKLMHPDPLRESGVALYKALSQMELEEPGRWAQVYSEVDSLIQESGSNIDDLRQY
jgi:hypothetical protein